MNAITDVRVAEERDLPAVAASIRELLRELGAEPPSEQHLEDEARALVEDPRAGGVLVADYEGEIIGVLGYSWQRAIRVPGRYGTIQELWVAPTHRANRIGARLIGRLSQIAREQGIERLEVGLPSERYPELVATEAFYSDNHFTGIGLRMKRVV